MGITQSEHKEKFLKHLNMYREPWKSEHYINDEVIGYKAAGYPQYEISITMCLEVIDFYNDFVKYIENLKVGDYTEYDSYGRQDAGKILKINMKRKTDKYTYMRFPSLISSIIIKDATFKHEPKDIMYLGITFYDACEAHKSVSQPRSLHPYDISIIQKIIDKINTIKEG